MIEYGSKKEAQAAIDDFDNTEFMGNQIRADWAFWSGPSKQRKRR
jgi:hypothetical protein